MDDRYHILSFGNVIICSVVYNWVENHVSIKSESLEDNKMHVRGPGSVILRDSTIAGLGTEGSSCTGLGESRYENGIYVPF